MSTQSVVCSSTSEEEVGVLLCPAEQDTKALYIASLLSVPPKRDLNQSYLAEQGYAWLFAPMSTCHLPSKRGACRWLRGFLLSLLVLVLAFLSRWLRALLVGLFWCCFPRHSWHLFLVGHLCFNHRSQRRPWQVCTRVFLRINLTKTIPRRFFCGGTSQVQCTTVVNAERCMCSPGTLQVQSTTVVNAER